MYQSVTTTGANTDIIHYLGSSKITPMQQLLLRSAMLMICLSSSIIIAQTHYPGAQSIGYSKSTGQPNFVRFNSQQSPDRRSFDTWLQQHVLQGDPQQSFLSFRQERDAQGNQHTRYRQYYKGYPIAGTMLISHEKNNTISSFNGSWFSVSALKNSLVLSETTALQKALKHVHAKRYKWENKAEEQQLRQALKNPQFSFYPKGEAMILPVATKGSTAFYYVYRFDIYAEAPLSRRNIYVDATSGQILKEQALLCSIDSPGSADTKYSGTQPIVTDSYSGGFRLREAGRGNGIETYNMNNGVFYNAATDFSNAGNSWTNTGPDQAATDAHWGAEMTYDYYLNVHYRNSIDGNGYALLSYVHYDTNFANAFWDGIRMTYGDGAAVFGFSIMTGLDVCGHEITHGLVSNTAELWGDPEGDALNEALADIFGTSVEWHARPGNCDWIMGKDITANQQGIRNMTNPHLFQDPDTYLGTYWDLSDPHRGAGPFDHWFYILSVGENGSNDFGNPYTITGIGMSAAEQITYRALVYYMTPFTDYADARACSILAAEDLYGSCSNEVVQTTNAWYAVGVGAAYVPLPPVSSFSSDLIYSCNIPVTVQFNPSIQSGNVHHWDFGDGGSSTQSQAAHTYTANGYYPVKLVAMGCSGNLDSITYTNYIHVDNPPAPVAYGGSECTAGTLTLSAGAPGTLSWYDNPGGTLLHTGPYYVTPSISSTTTYYVSSAYQQPSVFGGPASTSIGPSIGFADSTGYLKFKVLTNCILKTVRTNAVVAGVHDIELRDGNGVVLQTFSLSIPAGTSIQTFNLALTPGDYEIQPRNGPINSRLRGNTTGINFPYDIDNMLHITGSNTGFYYAFYNWEVERAPCISPLSAVTATVGSASPTFVKSTGICQGDSLILLAGGAGNYVWDNGATSYSIAIQPTVTTQYTVTGQSPGCVGTSSAVATVTVNSLPVVAMSVAQGTYCASAQTVMITGTPMGGVFSGPGVSIDQFNPEAADAGIHTLEYAYTDSNSCGARTAITVTVYPLPHPVLQGLTQYCVSDASQTLHGFPLGGTYSGPGMTGSSFNPGTAGIGMHSVSYSITDVNSCSNTTTLTLFVDACTGISETASDPTLIRLYPNPSTGSIHIEAPDLNLQLSVIDALGREVRHYSIQGNTSIDLSELSRGLYICRFQREGYTQHIRLIKN